MRRDEAIVERTDAVRGVRIKVRAAGPPRIVDTAWDAWRGCEERGVAPSTSSSHISLSASRIALVEPTGLGERGDASRALNARPSGVGGALTTPEEARFSSSSTVSCTDCSIFCLPDQRRGRHAEHCNSVTHSNASK